MSHLRWAEEALNHLSFGVLLLASDGMIAFANRAAEGLLDRREGIKVLGGKLVGSHHAGSDQLASVIAGATDGGSQIVRLDRGTGQRPLHVVVIALPSETENQLASSGPGVMAVVVDPEATTAPSSETLHALYGLTKAEACLARHLVAGDRLEDYAQNAGISVNTARTHLKSIFAKTDTDRQADVIRLLAWILLDGSEKS